MIPVRTPLLAMWVGGNKVSEVGLRLIETLTFTDREKKATDGTVVFTDTYLELMDSKIFKKGRRISFLVGWTVEAAPVGPFMVKKYSVSAGEDGVPRLTVNFQDLSHKMNKKKKRRKHLGKPVDIIKKIATEHDLGYDIESLADILFDDDQSLIQSHMTDAKLLQQLAKKYGYVWGLEGSTLYFRRPNSMDFTGKQKTVPLLSYRINGSTLKTFGAEIKFHKKGKRKGAAEEGTDIDFTTEAMLKSMGAAATKFVRETLVEYIPNIADAVGIEPGQDADDTEAGTSTNGSKKKTEERRHLKQETGFFYDVIKKGKDDSDKDEDVEESDATSGNVDGNKDKHKKAAAALAATEVVEATLEPTVASIMYRAGMAVQVAGMGTRLSGKYHVTEVAQSYSPEGFKTTLKAIKRAFNPSRKAKSAEDKAAESDAPVDGGGDGGGTGDKAPSKTWERRDLAPDTGQYSTKVIKKTKKVDGKDDV